MRRIVLKVGSAVLTQNGALALDRLRNLVNLISLLKEKYEIILVSSGAVAAGYSLLELDKKIIANKQVLAALGQPLLLDTYRRKFSKYNILCSQVLLEASLFKDSIRLNNARDAIEVMLQNNIVPIINENDVTATDELVFGDNDQLSAYITEYFEGDLLVILTDIDGYYDKNPHHYDDAKLQKIVTNIDKSLLEEDCSANSEFATGGIVTKLKAADFLMNNKKNMFLTSGFDLRGAYDFLLDNKHSSGTVFVGKE
jgi:glutamate 5-kinase